MAFIELIESASDGAPVTNHARAFAHRPAVYSAWAELLGAIKSTMDERLYELVTLAAARGLRSSYWAGCCSSATSLQVTSSPSRRSLPLRRSLQ